MMQKPVIETFAIPEPVPRQIKGNPRNDDQIRCISLMIRTARSRLQEAERPFVKILMPLDAAQHHVVTADRRIQHPLSRADCRRQNQPRVGFIMGRCIQRNTAGTGELIKSEQIKLRGMACCEPRIMAERTALCQQLRSERTLGHTISFS